jgi:hypothetical protein
MLDTTRVYAVNLGANDGKSLDPLFDLYEAGARGLLVEPDDRLYEALQANVPWARTVKVKSSVTPMNINTLLSDMSVPAKPDIFKIDIDGYDIFVVKEVLDADQFRPRVIIMEINEKIPPPILFSINYYTGARWHRDHRYGVSLQKLVDELASYRYIPVALDWNNLFLVDNLAFPTEFDGLDISVESLFATGYCASCSTSTQPKLPPTRAPLSVMRASSNACTPRSRRGHHHRRRRLRLPSHPWIRRIRIHCGAADQQ